MSLSIAFTPLSQVGLGVGLGAAALVGVVGMVLVVLVWCTRCSVAEAADGVATVLRAMRRETAKPGDVNGR